jgi:lipoate-protein ligase A
MPWRLLLTPPLGGPENMALDEGLMARARRTGETVLRVYTWAVPTLSLGRNQRARDAYDVARLRRAGVDVVRRPTGGRALLHDREITYSVTGPIGVREGLAATYQRINALLLHALGALGVEAQVAAPADRAPSPTAAPCFAEPVRGELVLRDRKLVGSAQWRHEGAFLQHGSMLVEDDQALIPSFMTVGTTVPPAPATLRAALGRTPGVDEVAESLWSAVRTLADADAAPLVLDSTSRLDAERLAERYRDSAWTWRR